MNPTARLIGLFGRRGLTGLLVPGLLISATSCGVGLATLDSAIPGPSGVPAAASIQMVQSNNQAQINVGAISAVFGAANSAGNLIAVHIWENRGATALVISSIGDSASNTYFPACTSTSTGGGHMVAAIYFAANISAASSNTVTVGFSSPADTADISITEFSGVSASGALDQISTNSTVASVEAGSSGTTAITTQANELVTEVINVNGNNIAFSSTPPQTLLFTDDGSNFQAGQAAFSVVSASGAFAENWTWNFSDAYAACIATFKSAH